MAEEKRLTVEEAIKESNKKYRPGSIVLGSEMAEVEVIDTGCISLNKMLDCGGIPKGRLIEVSGAPSTGKTALAMYLAVKVQKTGGKVLWIDAERVFNPVYTKQMGIDLTKLVVFTPESGEQALEVIESHVLTGGYSLIVVDSVAALVPEKELDSEPTDVTIALVAKMLSRHLRVVTGPTARTGTIILYINQIRDNLMTFGYGKKTVTTGGKALPFYCSVRLEVKAVGKIKDKNDQVVGNKLKIETIKNKVGLPFKTCEIDLYFNSGIDVAGDILDVAVQQKVVNIIGRSYIYGEVKVVGRDAFRNYLIENPKALEEIKNKIK